MAEKRIKLFDRRKGNDRRSVYRIGYFINGGLERRRITDRRSYMERRSGWIWVEDCCSVQLENFD
ncbi:hypothetical protein ACFL0H_06720 [Thermodesulfobacteriota bacterium]